MKNVSVALIGLAALTVPLLSAAQSYQIEADITFTRSSFDLEDFEDFDDLDDLDDFDLDDLDDGGSGDANSLNLSARYYLAPVQTVGPWSESAFLQKSSFAGIQLSRVSGDVDGDTDFTIDAQYVTPENLIIGGALSSDDRSDISVFGGKYLDDRTTAIARISLGDVDSIGGEYKTMMQLASGNDLTVEAGLALIDAADSGFELDGSGTYYLSDQLGVLAGLSFVDDGFSDTTSLITGAEYFLSETLAVRGGLSLGFGDSSDTTAIALGVVGRF